MWDLNLGKLCYLVPVNRPPYPMVGANCRGIADEYAMEGSSQCVFRDVG